jgi:hypothetical protein
VIENAIREQLLIHLKLRVEAEMTRYIQRRLASGATEPLPIMGGDARTGAAIRKFVTAADFTMPSASLPQ